ncbi:histone H3-like centromeric protein A [Serinus canaria]|uniref:histone H3-like centromeric protein A n=1 Tax=Serinus canaria TaxID=9135 RepID=UPI0021CD03FA|nr:histone H3-like centromeric protein A [Serinus canaria]
MPRPKLTPRRRRGPPAPPWPQPRARSDTPMDLPLNLHRYQSSTRLLLHAGPFACLVQEICLLLTHGVDYHWQRMALLALQEAAEAFMVQLLEDMYMCSLDARRVTLFPKDVQLAWCLQGPQVGASE